MQVLVDEARQHHCVGEGVVDGAGVAEFLELTHRGDPPAGHSDGVGARKHGVHRDDPLGRIDDRGDLNHGLHHLT